MSVTQAFRRVAVPAQAAQRLETTTIAAPSRGIIMDENQAFMQPGAAIVCDNWKPTLRGVALRGGCVRWCALPETTPVISAFQYAHGTNVRMFAANASKIYDVTSSVPALIASGQLSGNCSTAQLANQGGDYLLVLTDKGDYPWRYDGTTWTHLNTGQINGPAGTTVANGQNLTYVCKSHNRLIFIEGNSMTAWYLPLNAVQGTLAPLYLSGAATKGGKLLFIAMWSVNAGDGLDDKTVFCTDQGELLVFSGSDPSDANNWKQAGRYDIPAPMGMNAHIQLGGDLLIATTSGIVPISSAISRTPEELELAMITRAIKPMWREEVANKIQWSWTMMNWPEYGGIFTTWPGGAPGDRYCAVVNGATGAWARFVGWDATCFVRMGVDMFFGTQDGYIMHADRGGYDDGQPYVCTLVGGWEMFQAPSQTVTWRQARAIFAAPPGQPFQPQISACTDFVVTLPPPPQAGPDPGTPDAWDEGLWGPDQGPPPPHAPSPADRLAYAQWDQKINMMPVVGNTMWVSVGMTGFTHAPIVQVTIAQQASPGQVELIAIAATFERAGINV